MAEQRSPAEPIEPPCRRSPISSPTPRVKPCLQTGQVDLGEATPLSFRISDLVRSEMAHLARAIPFERALEARGGGALRAMDQRLYVAVDRGTLLGLSNDKSTGNVIFAFTAADAVDGLLERIPAAKHANLSVPSMVVRELVLGLGNQRVDGLCINPFGPRASGMVAGEDFVELVELARARATSRGGGARASPSARPGRGRSGGHRRATRRSRDRGHGRARRRAPGGRAR